MAEGQDARVQEIRARSEAATPGPWQPWPDGTEESVESVSVGRFVCHLNSNMRQFREDAAFIAQAREDVPWLLARLGALEAERDVLRVERDIARRVEQEFSAAADAWQAEAVKVRAERDALRARAERAESALEVCVEAIADGVRELPRGGVTGGGVPFHLISPTWKNFHLALTRARAVLAAAGEGES